MRPLLIGRTLGIGLRVAGRVAGDALRSGSETPAARPAVSVPVPQIVPGEAAIRAVRGAAKGSKGFLAPFRRVGGILWLEVTGSFFLIFAAFFAQNLWRLRPDLTRFHVTPQVCGSIAAFLLFLYLGVSSFWRARKR